MEEVIKKFQDYLTKNCIALQKHCDAAEENNCKWEVKIIRQRIEDLFIIRYRLEQLLSKAGYEDLCVLACFNEKVRKELDKLV